MNKHLILVAGAFIFTSCNSVTEPARQAASQPPAAISTSRLNSGMSSQLEEKLYAAGYSSQQVQAIISSAQSKAAQNVTSAMRAGSRSAYATSVAEDPFTMAPAFAQGAVEGLGIPGLFSFGDKQNILGMILPAVMGGMNFGGLGGLPLGNSSMMGNLLGTITGSMMPSLGGAGLGGNMLPGALSILMSSGMGGLGGSGLDMGSLQSILSIFGGSAVSSIPQIPGLNQNQQLDALKGLSQGGISGLLGLFGGNNMGIPELANLSQLFTGGMVGGVGGGAFSDSLLGPALQMLTQGAVSGVGGFNGGSTNDLSSLILAITSGGVGGLGNFSGNGFDANTLAQLTQFISGGATQGLGGFDPSMLTTLLGSVTHGSTSGLGQIPGLDPSLMGLASMFITNGAVGNLGGLGNLFGSAGGGMDGNTVATLVQLLTQGSTTGLFSAGLNTNQVQPLLGLIQQGAQSGVAGLPGLPQDQQFPAIFAALMGTNAGMSQGPGNFFSLLLALFMNMN